MVVITSFTLPFLKIFLSIMTIVRLLVNQFRYKAHWHVKRYLYYGICRFDISVCGTLKMCIFIKFYGSFADLSDFVLNLILFDCYDFRS